MSAITFEHDHYSGRFDRPIELELNDLTRMGGSLQTLTEIDSDARAKALITKDYGVVYMKGGNGNDSSDVGIRYRYDTWALIDSRPAKHRRISNLFHFRNTGSTSKVYNWSTTVSLWHKPSGKVLVVSVAHLPAHVEDGNGWRPGGRTTMHWANSRAWYAQTKAEVKAHGGDGLLMVADFNVDIKKSLFRSWLKATFPALRPTWNSPFPARGTHAGGRIIDIPLISKELVIVKDPQLQRTTGSDHTGFSETLGFKTPTIPAPKETLVATSQNGFPALPADSPKLYTWIIKPKGAKEPIKLRMRNGSAGFLLAHFVLWFAETIEPLYGRVLDDWAYAYRAIRGSETTLSNHSSGTAVDLNATQHPLGKTGTYKAWQYTKIRARLLIYRGAIRAGLDYNGRKDEMHYEINKSLSFCESIAKRMMKTERGLRILKDNPTQKAVILDGNAVIPAPAVKPKPAPMPLLRKGMRSEAVKVLQRELGLTPDGIFGPKTELAVKSFQKAHGLTADGIVGPKTWAKLGH